jgi:hypothetical protein
MVQPFPQDHGAGAQRGARRGIGLVRAGVFGGAGHCFHGLILAQIAVRRYENTPLRPAHHALCNQDAPGACFGMAPKATAVVAGPELRVVARR